MILLPPDLKDFLRLLNSNKVKDMEGRGESIADCLRRVSARVGKSDRMKAQELFAAIDREAEASLFFVGIGMDKKKMWYKRDEY